MENYSRNNIIKKNIILIPAEYDGNSNQKGILSLEYYDNKVVGSLRCFNLKKTNEVYEVGIAVGDNIFKTKASVGELSNLKIQINGECEVSNKVSCVIVSLQNKSYSTLLWGSTKITKASENSFEIQSLIEKANIMDSQEKTFMKQASDIIGSVKEKFLQTNSDKMSSSGLSASIHSQMNNQDVNFADNEKVFSKQNDSPFDDNIGNNFNFQKIKNLFDNQNIKNTNSVLNQNENIELSKNSQEYNSQIASKQEEVFEDEMLESYIDKVYAETEDDKKSNDYIKPKRESFFSKVSGQVEKMFQDKEPEKVLENIIPDSKFCRVENGDDYYVFGVIYEGGVEKCLCYGVPSEYKDVPPKELEGYCQWLPVDPENYLSKGYWLTYQDAKTGENIMVEII